MCIICIFPFSGFRDYDIPQELEDRYGAQPTHGYRCGLSTIALVGFIRELEAPEIMKNQEVRL